MLKLLFTGQSHRKCLFREVALLERIGSLQFFQLYLLGQREKWEREREREREREELFRENNGPWREKDECEIKRINQGSVFAAASKSLIPSAAHFLPLNLRFRAQSEREASIGNQLALKL